MKAEKRHILCIGGTLCTEKLWCKQVAHLKSEYTFTIPNIMDFSDISDLAQHILQQAPKNFSIAGMSAGVPIAFAIIRELIKAQQIDRLNGLILIAGNPYETPADKQEKFDNNKAYVREHGLQKYAQDVLTANIADTHKDNIELQQDIVNMASTFTPDAFYKHMDMLKYRPCSLDTLKQITCAVLAISGAEDPLCPPALHDVMATNASRGTHISLKHTGHYINIESPETLNMHMHNFLNTQITPQKG